MPNSVLRLLNEDEFPIWDNFVDESKQGTLFHKSFWLGALGYKPVIFGYFRDGKILAGLPLTNHVELGIKMAVHPLITPYQGVIFQCQDSKYVTRLSNEKEINREFAKMLKRTHHHVRLRFPPGMIDLQPFIWEGFSTNVTYTYIIHLENDLNNIWMSMTDINRNRIRKAENDGITVNFCDDFSKVINLVEMTFAGQGKEFFPKSAAYAYNNVLEKRSQIKSFIAKDTNNNILAAISLVWDRKSSYYLLGGHNSEKNHRGALALTLWEAIKYSKEKLNLQEFNFEGSMIPRLEDFLRSFGGELVPCYRIEWTKIGYGALISIRRRLSGLNFMRSLYTRTYTHVET